MVNRKGNNNPPRQVPPSPLHTRPDQAENDIASKTRAWGEYTQIAMEGAQYRTLADGTVFGEIPGFQGVWANAPTVEECRTELAEVLEEWLELHVADGIDVPTVNGIGLSTLR